MTYEHVSFCFSLPRSRSQWLAWLYGRYIESWHDPLARCRSIEELKAAIDARGTSRLFIADSAGLLFHDALLKALPGMRCYYVWRDPDEVAASIDKQIPGRGAEALPMLRRMFRRADDLYQSDWSGWVSYANLDNSAAIWHYRVTGISAPEEYRLLLDRVIDTPLTEQFKRGDHEAFARLVQHAEISW